jgi:MFS family permease
MESQSTIKVERENQLRSNIKKAYFIRFFKNLHFFAAVLVPFFTVWGEISFSDIMILQAIFTFSLFLFEIPTGAIADYFGRKISVVLSASITAMGIFIYVLTPHFWMFVLGEVFMAIGGALMSGAFQAIVYDSLQELGEEKKSKVVFNRLGSIGLAALLIASPIGSLIAEYVSLRAVLFFTGFPVLLAGFIALTIEEPKHKKEEKTSFKETVVEGFTYLRDHKELKILMLDYVSIGSIVFFIIWVYQVLLTEYGVSIKYFGFIHAAIVLSQMGILHSVTHIERIVGGKRNYLVYTAYLVGILFLVLAFATNVYMLIVLIILISAFGLTRKSLYSSYLNKHIESHHRATVFSFISMAFSLILAISNVIFGKLTDINSSYPLILVGTLILIIAFTSKIKEEHLID